MTGVDTNVLLRWIIRDPEAPEQSRRVEAAFASGGPFFVNQIVLAEIAWVLRRRAGFTRGEVVRALRAMLDAPQLRVEAPAVVADAVTRFEAGGAGFTDNLIGAVNRAAGCASTLTFDRRAGRGDAFSAVP